MVEYAEFEVYMASRIVDPITEEDTKTIAQADGNSDLQVSDKGMTLLNFGTLDQGLTQSLSSFLWELWLMTAKSMYGPAT